MSHGLGVICEQCHAVLIDASCPERLCPGNHGYAYADGDDWPGHEHTLTTKAAAT